MNTLRQRVQHWLTGRLTLRLKLTFWVSSLLSATSIILIILINVVAYFAMPHILASVLVGPFPSPAGQSATQIPFSTPPPNSQVVIKGVVIEEIQQVTVQQIFLISVLSAVLIIILGSSGAYWMASRALRPVNRIIQSAQNVNSKNLDTRLSWDGPEDELGKLIDVFNAMLARLGRAFEQQQQFAANVAHELRNPLATLRTTLEVIQDDPTASLEDYRDMSITLEQNLARLERLIENLLLLARGEREIMRRPVNLEILAKDVSASLSSLADEKMVSVELDLTPNVVVPGDEILLARALTNLVENGIHFNRPGGKVQISIKAVPNWAEIRVEDDGVGISPEEQARIFERFYRVRSSSTQHQGGFGLGLTITAHIVQLHNGTIQVESKLGCGTTFAVHLPL